ncbi:hypothetical protein LXL04_032200 [Taraxacum kok-saghyz]
MPSVFVYCSPMKLPPVHDRCVLLGMSLDCQHQKDIVLFRLLSTTLSNIRFICPRHISLPHPECQILNAYA